VIGTNRIKTLSKSNLVTPDGTPIPMSTQAEKGTAFRQLHHRDKAFLIPNPWDAGSARMLTNLGFEALATSSAGYAASIGKQDYAVGRDGILKHIRELVAASDLPISADLENGFADEPEAAAKTYLLAANAGAVGGSIEDATGREEGPIYCIEHAAARVKAAAEAAHALPFTFTLTARAENYLHGRQDLKDTIKRLQAYQEAGADVLYAPGIRTREEIAEVVRSVDRPVNVLTGLPGFGLTHKELSELGVKRISLGSALARVAYSAFVQAAKEMQERGTFSFTDLGVSSSEIAKLLGSY
jgi:2-methylisocitrate lyase-like PEP mutase family enzyme